MGIITLITRKLLTVGQAVIIPVVFVLILPAPSPGAVFWEDSFEGANLNLWSDPVPGNLVTSTDVAFGGSRSAKGIYTGEDSGGFTDRYFGSPMEDLYMRFYYFTSNFTYNDVGTKHFNVGDGVHYPNFWLQHQGADRGFFFISQAPAEDCGFGGTFAYCEYKQNVNNVQTADNRWYCIETHIRMNTPGVANGQIEMWVDGVQTANWQNRLFRGAGGNGPNGNSSQATLSFVRLYIQHGVGNMYYDRMAAGSTRIGCSGTIPVSDTTPPSPPTGLSAK